MAPSIIAVAETNSTIKDSLNNTPQPVQEALSAARTRFAERNPTSLQLHNEALKSLPGGNTRSLLHTSPFPVSIKKGVGYQVISEDDHTYTDLVGEMSAALYGHSHPLILSTLTHTLQTTGLNLSGTSRLEAQHAALLCARFHLDRVRFTNSGTEANLHALAAARAFTGRRKVVVFEGGYHGGCFAFPGYSPARNVVDREDFIVAPYNDVSGAQRAIEDEGGREVAAVLVEAVQGGGPAIVGTREFLKQVQSSAEKVGALFVLDEVQTSRLGEGGVQGLEGLRADLVTLGKWVGGGVSFGAFGGREEVMRVYDPRSPTALAHSGTFNNNTLSLAAGFTGLSKIYTPSVSLSFNALGDNLRLALQSLSTGTKMTVTGRGSLLGIHFLADGKKELASWRERRDEEGLKELFWLEMMEGGFWISRRGSVALILGTPEGELERFVGCVRGFLERHEGLVRI